MSDESTAREPSRLESLGDPDPPAPPEPEPFLLSRVAHAPRSRFTPILKVVAIAMVGFIAGVQAQKLAAPKPSGSAATGLQAGRTRALADSSRRYGVAGEVKFIDGSTIYVTDPSGTTIEVHATRSSRFIKPARGALKDIRPGDRIVVRGARGSDGAVVAGSVLISHTRARP